MSECMAAWYELRMAGKFGTKLLLLLRFSLLVYNAGSCDGNLRF